MERKRVWFYCRVAHNGSDSIDLLAVQRSKLEVFAKEHDLVVVGVSDDIGSGLTLDRPGLLAFLNAVEDKGADMLLICDLSRLGRDLDQIISCWLWLRGRGVHIYTISDGEIDLSVNALLLESARK